jgi:apolipoprotein D and lipocalin family protein
MQFIWPIRAEYRIIYLNDTYTQTVIGRSKRDYVWIMARTPRIPLQDYDHIISFIESQGYDISRVQQAPHENPGSVSVENPAANPPQTINTVK